MIYNNMPNGIGAGIAMKLMNARLGYLNIPHYYKDTVDGTDNIAKQLIIHGGFP